MSEQSSTESRALLTQTLAGGRLPVWATAAAAGAGLALAGLLAVATRIQGVAGTGVVAAIAFLVIQSLWSWRVEGVRNAKNRLAQTFIYASFIIALVPLLSVLWTVFSRGIGLISASFFESSMRNVSPRSPGGGVGHAIVGTLEQVAIAALIAVPIGVLAAIYLIEYGRGPLKKWISFFVDVMTGVPSIVAGLFAFTGFILALGWERSGVAASLALAILMIPVIIRTTEEMLRIVPTDLREASYALGVPKWRTILRVVIPTALAGIITGVMLSVARVAGETAPLLLTTFLSQSYNYNVFTGPQAAMPTFVWDQFSSGTNASTDRAWAGALTLIAIVTITYASAKYLAKRFAPKA